MYFHKRRIGIAFAFLTGYGILCYNTTKHPKENVRLAIAGSIANMACDCLFHIVDTVNIRSKVVDVTQTVQRSAFEQVKAIYKKEGMFGFGKGFSACFYGSIICGLIYFYLYKSIKQKYYQVFGEKCNFYLAVLVTTIIAELFTIMAYFPFDLIKCRLQSKNFHFKYQNLPHAFKYEI